MKLLILTPGIYPDRHSGIPKLVYNLAQALQSRGVEIHVITRQYQPEHPASEVVDGMHVYRCAIPARGHVLYVLWPLVMAWQSLKMQRALRARIPTIDAVWIHNPWWLLLQNPKRLWPRARVLYDFHSDIYGELQFNSRRWRWLRLQLARLFDRLAVRGIRRSDAVIVHSQYTRQRCLALCKESPGCPIAVIPAGANMQRYFPLTAAEKAQLKTILGIPRDKPAFLTVRGLKPRTGVDQLVMAAALLKQAGRAFHLTVIGRGIMHDEIQRLIDFHGLERNVTLLSGLSEDRLAEYYRASDVFVLPTQGAEGFGLATVEALGSGLVVLGTDNSATPELLRHYHADWTIPGVSAHDIFTKMQQFCVSPSSLAIPSGEIRKITEEHFTWTIAANRFLTTLQTLQ